MPLTVSRRAVTRATLLIAAMAVAPGATRAAGETAKESLLGIEWRVTELAGTKPIEGHIPTLSIDESGRAGGHSGCNTYFSRVALADGTISFSEIGSTYIACEPLVMEQEQELFEALGLTAAFTLEGGTLELLDGDGALLVRLAAAA